MVGMRNGVGCRRRALLAGTLAVAWTGLLLWGPVAAQADQVIADDLIVQGSTCTGLNCVNGEDFGFDTLRLNEQNTRMCFNDTSAAGFASQDWQLVANASGSGGADAFGIHDATNCGEDVNAWPFRLDAGAPNNSFFMHSTGRIGLRTANPVLDMHIATGNTPAIRLEQTNASGFTAETWDIAGNEANFFVRDVTNGSRLPFRIRPGAPTSAIDIAANGNVGLNTASPDNALHVRRANGTAAIQVEETSATTASRILGEWWNNGPTFMRFRDTSTSPHGIWRLGSNAASEFLISNSGSGVARLSEAGDLRITGAYLQSSDRKAKRAIEPVHEQSLLSKLRELPLSTWQYKSDSAEARHLGPMAQDFHRIFGLGSRPRFIAPADMAGVALSSIKELDEELRAQREINRQLEERLTNLEQRLAAVESP